jgi:hypothetical protein
MRIAWRCTFRSSSSPVYAGTERFSGTGTPASWSVSVETPGSNGL